MWGNPRYEAAKWPSILSVKIHDRYQNWAQKPLVRNFISVTMHPCKLIMAEAPHKAVWDTLQWDHSAAVPGLPTKLTETNAGGEQCKLKLLKAKLNCEKEEEEVCDGERLQVIPL